MILYFILAVVFLGVSIWLLVTVRTAISREGMTLSTVLEHSTLQGRRIDENIVENVSYSGEAQLPYRVFAGDSQTMRVVLDQEPETAYSNEANRTIQEEKHSNNIRVNLRKRLSGKSFIEIELMAAGCEITGSVIQRQPLNQKTLKYRWNCFFPNPGRLTLTLVVRAISEDLSPPRDVLPEILGEKDFNTALRKYRESVEIVELADEITEIDHVVQVTSLGPLTQRQVWVFAAITGAVGFISGSIGIVEALRNLGVI